MWKLKRNFIPIKLARYAYRWENNVKMKGGAADVYCSQLAPKRVQWRALVKCNANSASMKGRKYLCQPSDYQLVTKDSATCS
jgi:hypothetical protein